MTRSMFVLALLVSACSPRETSQSRGAAPAATPPPAAPSAQIATGQKLISNYGCGVCHVIPGVPGAQGTLGPTLAGVASRPTISEGVVQNTPANLAQYIQNPPSLNPDASMPALGFSDQEAAAMAAYLLSAAK